MTQAEKEKKEKRATTIDSQNLEAFSAFSIKDPFF